MVAIRDLKCSMDIAEMAALGKFEQEFIMYGCCYLQNGERQYRISDQSMDLYHFQQSSVEQGVYCTPVTEVLNRVLVPSGMREEYEYQTRVSLGKQLQTMYPKAMLETFMQLAEAENDTAAPLFNWLKKKLMGCFDRDILQLVKNLLCYAYWQKKLTRETYQSFCQWLQYLYDQMEDDIVVKKQFRRTFFGFAVNDGAKKRYYVNASEGEIYRQRERLLCKGALCSAVLQRTCYYAQQPDLRQEKQAFQQQLEQWMNDWYWQLLNHINQLPTAVSTELYEKLHQQAKAAQAEAMTQHLQLYRSLWNLV